MAYSIGMYRPVWLAAALSLGLLLAREPRASELDDAPAPAAAEPAATPTGLLAAADVAVAAGDLNLARLHFEHLATQFPNTPEANEARRALRIMAAGLSSIAPASIASSVPTAVGATAARVAEEGDVVVRNEPYSLRTSERLRLSVWEKLDFGVTSFLYGMSVGLSYALSQDSGGVSAIALGGVAYTLGSVLFLKLAHPDRGDLPLALAITSYVPTTTLLVMSTVDAHPDAKTSAGATAVAGLLSVPAAVLAARHLTLDPGDTQLVRDAGFWGLALSTLGMLGFGGSTSSTPYYDRDGYALPSGRKVAVAGLVGLYGGLGLGLLGAATSEVSLERVRVATWGGYGGGVVGALMGLGANDGREQDLYRGAAIGALAGLVITFLATSSLDGIPNEEPVRQSWRGRITPMMVQVAGSDGRLHPGLGLGATLF
jgi:hypothetical protein